MQGIKEGDPLTGAGSDFPLGADTGILWLFAEKGRLDGRTDISVFRAIVHAETFEMERFCS